MPGKLEGRKPKNLLDYIQGLPLNSGFLVSVEQHGKEIKELLRQAPAPLEEALFIIDLNGFREDLIKVIGLLSEIRKQRETVDMEHAIHDERKEQVESFVMRASKFYDVVHDYQRHFGIRRWLPTINEVPVRFNLLSESPFCYKASDSTLENAKRACELFESYQPAFKNFINVFYGDGEAGERFLGRNFRSLMDDYRCVKLEADNIKQALQNSKIAAAEAEISEYDENLRRLLREHPATLFRSMETLLHYIKS